MLYKNKTNIKYKADTGTNKEDHFRGELFSDLSSFSNLFVFPPDISSWDPAP